MNAIEGRAAEHSGALVARIAAAAKTSESDVASVFTTYGIPLAYPPARPRSVRVSRLHVRGVRAGTGHDGRIERTFTFDRDLTALVASNLRGKTSVLELITWCLRGSPRDRLQADVRRWLTRVELDATITGQAVGFRLSLQDGNLARGVVLTASDAEHLPGAEGADVRQGISTLIDTEDEIDFSVQVAALMLDRLDLQPLVNAVSKDKRVGTQTHGWPAYYSTMYLPAGPDKPLLGDLSMAGLPGRLLQVFLDLPAAAVLTRVKATRDVLEAETNQQREDAGKISEQRSVDRARALDSLKLAQDKLDGIRRRPSGPSLIDLAAAARRLARDVAEAGEAWDETNRIYRTARQQRQVDEKVLNDIKESEVARLLFHGLDPSACPRCEAPITKERREEERNIHRCAVCTVEVVGDSPDDDDVEAEAQARVTASRSAENLTRRAMEVAESKLSGLTKQLDEAEKQLRTADPSGAARELMDAELEVARWKGALEMVPEPPAPEDQKDSTVLKVLEAAVKVLDQESKTAASELFTELNAEIVDLAHRFGMNALERVEITRAAQLKVVKGGGAKSNFGQQSPGEQVRLRIAVAIALIRVGARLGVSTHPGFFLIDSPKAEEVQDFDAAVVFRELSQLAADDHIQVLITTADFKLSNAVLPAESIVAAEEGAPLW